MKFKNVFIFFIFILFFISCSKDQIKKSVIKEKNLPYTLINKNLLRSIA